MFSAPSNHIVGSLCARRRAIFIPVHGGLCMTLITRYSLRFIAGFTSIVSLFANSAYASDQLGYVPLPAPCRLADTRSSSGGAGPLTQTHGVYLFGTMNADISSPMQNGNPSGCGLPSGIAAISVNMNLLDATASGNIATWSADAGSTAPNIGTAVYNPTVTVPTPGQVRYNTGYTTIPTSDRWVAGIMEVGNHCCLHLSRSGRWPLSFTDKTSFL